MISERYAFLMPSSKSRVFFNSDEVRIMREHPSYGARILSSIKQFEGIIPVIRHHHEFYNGYGYPYGLSKDEIPIIARILAVADAYDAMTTDRHYRRAMSIEEAIEELKRNAGKQFDPEIVEAFLQTNLSEREKWGNFTWLKRSEDMRL